MSQLLEKPRTETEQQLPRLFRNRTVEYTLLVLGGLIALFGAWVYLVPTSWILSDLSQTWYLGSWVAGGALLTAGFGMFGASLRDQSGHWTFEAVMGFVLGALSLAGAVAAAVLLIV